MISQELAKVERKLNRIFEDVEVDVLWYEDGRNIETIFYSTEHDPSVGIRGGERVRMAWEAIERDGEITGAEQIYERWDVEKQHDFNAELRRNRSKMEEAITSAFRSILEP